MICPNCNKENNNGVSFCVNCGTRLTPVQNTPPANPYEYKDQSTQSANTYTPNPQPQPVTPNPYPPENNINNPQQQYVNNDDEATNRTAKKLAIISLCLFIGRFVFTVLGGIFSGIFTYIIENASSSYSYNSSYALGSELLSLLLAGASFLCFVASLVLIIIAKVKISSKKLKNKFVNVVFWVEIGLIIASVVLSIIVVLLVVVACSAAITSC